MAPHARNIGSPFPTTGRMASWGGPSRAWNRLLPHLLFVALLWFGLGWVTDSHAQAAALPSFEVAIRDGIFTPKRLEVPAGQRVKIVLRNEGRSPVEFENNRMHIEKILTGGAASFIVLPALGPGEYEFVDEFHPSGERLVVIAR